MLREEKETIICFNESKEPAHIFTYNITWQKHLEKNLGLVATLDNKQGGKEYDIDKSRIKMPRAARKMTKSALMNLKKARAGHQRKRVK